MNKINDGGPAFPVANREAEQYASCLDDLANPNLDMAEKAHLSAKATALCGMTMRDYFAAKAMQEIMAFKFNQPIEDGMTRLSCAESYAKNAYIMADAMLVAREKGGAA